MSINIATKRASYQAVYALDIITAADDLTLLVLASRPIITRIVARKFSLPLDTSTRGTPLKTPLGTYLFLWPALLCLFTTYIARFVGDLLKPAGRITYYANMS